MTMNSTGRPTTPASGEADMTATVSGSRGLLQAEGLIFEVGSVDKTGVDLPEPKGRADRLGGVARSAPTGLPGLSEPEMMRHYVRLSQKNYAIDLGLFPLGSCTMKHNPRLNEKMARLPGFADIHPMQPQATVQGALELIDELAGWLMKLTNMPAVAMSPKAGAPRRTVRHAGDPRGAAGEGRAATQTRAGARLGARHQPGDGGAVRFHRRRDRRRL